MIAEIIFTGTELLLGQILNTNAQFLQQELSALGVDLYYQVTVGDNLGRCTSAIKQASGRADLVIIGGGLGPTEDDISREALAEALGVELVEHPDALAVVRRFFDLRGIPVSRNNLKQALVPRGGKVLDNPIGTAPGIILEKEGKIYILVPGPPSEFIKMVRERVIPYLREKLGGSTGVIKSRVLKFCGIGEALLDEKLSDLLKSNNPTLAPTAKFFEVNLRITAKARDDAEADEMIVAMEEKVRDRLGSFIFGVDDETLPGVVNRLLRETGKTIATMEDFTGGRLASSLSSADGADKTFIIGLVIKDLYRLHEKVNLGWAGELPGGISERVEHLAAALRKRYNCDIGVSVTAERDSSSDIPATNYKFYYAADFNGNKMSKEVLLWGEGENLAQRAAVYALVLLWRYLKHGIPF